MAVLERDLSRMDEVIINNHRLEVREFKSQRVISVYDIAKVHEKEVREVNQQFERNKEHLIKDEDYFELSREQFESLYVIQSFIPNNVKSIKVFTEQGYLMLVKTFSGDLAWMVQRELVNKYFRSKQLANSLKELSPELQVLINIELNQKKLEKEVAETRQQIAVVKETIIDDTTDWREWVNSRLSAIGAALGDYRRPRVESYEELERRARCNLDRRLENKIENMKKAGAGKKMINNTNKLDVIDEDPRLKEIYISIVKEMSIKYL